MDCQIDQGVLMGGTSKKIRATFLSDYGYPFNLAGHTVHFALTDYINLNSAPVLRRQAAVDENGGFYNVAVVSLTPADTVDLAGKYRYRFTVLDDKGGGDAIEGDLIITICTDKEAVAK